MTEKPRLFLLDAYALIYRAYYALIRAPRVTSTGFNTSAIFGFCNTLDDILRNENPSHIAVCFDPRGGNTFRHKEYPLYKAQRDKQPEDITASIPYIKDILAAYKIPAIEVEGYEADDVIGTLAHAAEREGFVTYMMTPDKDYGQLVTDNVFMYRPAMRGEGFEVRGPQQVCERYGISSPAQVIDMLALEGDASDNVPGCPGVGEKTAVKLIAEWGSVENLLENTDALKGALKKKVTENVEQIRMSKWLVTIKTDVPMGDITPASLARKEIDTDRLIEIYRTLEFRSLINKLRKQPESESSASMSAPLPEQTSAPAMGSLFDMDFSADENLPLAKVDASNYHFVANEAEAFDVIEKLKACDKIGLSVHAVGAEAMTATVCGVALASERGKVYYIPLNAREHIANLVSLFAVGGPLIVSADLKRDYLLLHRAGVTVASDYYDVGVAHYLISPEMKHDVYRLALGYLNLEMLPEGAEPKMLACQRADVALQLHPEFEKIIAEQDLKPLLYDIELPLIRVLAEMEREGVRINVDELSALSSRFAERLVVMENRVYELADSRFNISSPMQVGEVLFGKMKIDPNAKRTRKGAFSTTEEILEKYRSDYEIVDLILKIRALRKLLTTYVNALPALVNPETGKIHTSYNQTVTATGRISSTNPNLQNIPVRSDDGREIRRAFIADEGDVLLSADYSQIELRLMAELSGDAGMIEAFHSGADIHRATAAKINHIPLEDVTDDQRRAAKTANFGIIYGISAFGLSERLGIPRSEAKELINGYFRTYPGVKEYMDRCIEVAREQHYVSTVMGRKRMLPDIDSRSAVVRGYAERNAINAPLQGSAADIIKRAMVTIFNEMERRQMRSRMILQVHDELVFNVVPEELDALKELVATHMEGAYTGKVALEVSMDTGNNWLEAH